MSSPQLYLWHTDLHVFFALLQSVNILDNIKPFSGSSNKWKSGFSATVLEG